MKIHLTMFLGFFIQDTCLSITLLNTNRAKNSPLESCQ
jgi:hypothetical protein